MTVTKHRRCPFCGGKAVPILYGMPTFDAFQRAERGELAIGGCILSDDAPAWQCAEGHEFGALTRL